MSTVCALILWLQPCRSALPAVESSPAPTAESDVAASRTPIRRAESVDGVPGDRAPAPSLTSSLGLLGLMLGGVYVTLNWLRRKQNLTPIRPGAIDLIASRRLDAQAALHLVRIGQRVLAVGSSPAGTRTLAVIDDPEEIAVLISASTTSESRGAGFLGRTFPGHRTPVPATRDDERSLDATHAASGRSESPA